jgi:S-(hydroxymethyl)glutathione dehydrogenase/alcohol dehydrogenase
MSDPNQAQAETARGVVLVDGNDLLEIHDLVVAEPGPNEARIRTHATGLCHSDLHLIEGTIVRPRPIVVGHEGAGVVEAVGANVDHLSPGDHVVTCLVVGCGTCPECRAGNPVICANPGATVRGAEEPPRLTLDGVPTGQMGNVGALAERILMDARGVVAISPDMPFELAALLGCAVVTGLGAVFNVARVRPTERVAVIGCGGVGLNIVQGARIAGASQIIAVDLAPAKLQLAEQLGATHTVNASEADPVAAVNQISGGVDHAFEAIGLTSTSEQAIAMAAPGRTAYVVGILPGDAAVEMPSAALRRTKSLVGVFMGATRPHEDIPRYVELWEQGRLDLETMVSQVLPPERSNEGFAVMTGGEVARTVIGWNA